MGWVMFFVGLVLAPLIGWYLIGRRRADLPLTLLGLASVPMIVWGASLGAKIGPCKVGDCMSSGQHSRLVLVLVALGLLAVAFVLLALHRQLAGGGVLVVAEAVGAVGVQRVDTTALVALFLLGGAALLYLALTYAAQREATRVPDFPPPQAG
jgi:hypothetical protein